MKLHHKIARALGYDLIRRKKHPCIDTHTINLIHHHGIDLVLDVGANAGQFGAMLRAEGYGGELHSFEPVAATFAKLEEASAGDSRWHIHRLALGDGVGELVINVAESSDLSSFLNPNAFGAERYGQIAATARETVAVSTVDVFLAAQVPDWQRRTILLKMDTQGFDLQVVRGAAASLPFIRALVSELSLIPIYEGMPDYLAVLAAYQAEGFAVSGLFPISRRADLAVVEMDAVLVNTARGQARV